MAIYTVTKQNFLEWYFNSADSDQEDEAIRVDLAEKVVNELLANNTVTITAEDIFEQCNIEAMPSRYLNEIGEKHEDDYTEIGEDKLIDLSIDEIKLID